MADARRAFITGAASGIGLALAEQLEAADHRVYGVDIAQGTYVNAPFDVRDSDAWDTALDEATQFLGGVPDLICNVAGVLNLHWVHELDAKTVDQLIDINIKGVVHGTRLAAKRLLESHTPGHIINVASLAGLAPVPGLALYSATKHAVRAFSLSAALELRDRGIAVTVICPDAVQTPMLEVQRGDERARLTFSGARKPLTADDVARTMVDAIRTQPMEVALPRWRGTVAKLGGALPKSAAALLPAMRKRGRRQGGS